MLFTPPGQNGSWWEMPKPHVHAHQWRWASPQVVSFIRHLQENFSCRSWFGMSIGAFPQVFGVHCLRIGVLATPHQHVLWGTGLSPESHSGPLKTEHHSWATISFMGCMCFFILILTFSSAPSSSCGWSHPWLRRCHVSHLRLICQWSPSAGIPAQGNFTQQDVAPQHRPYLLGCCRSVGWSGCCCYCCSVKITREK